MIASTSNENNNSNRKSNLMDSAQISLEDMIKQNVTEKTSNKIDNVVQKTRAKIRLKFLARHDMTNEMARSILKIFETEHNQLKIVLILILVIVTSLSSYLSIESILSYFDYEVSTKLRTVYETPTLFPKVTICNINPFTTEDSFNFLKDINAIYFPEIDVFNTTQMAKLNYSEKYSLVWRIYLLATSKMNDAYSTIDDKKRLGHTIEDIILTCKFNNQKCSSKDFEWKFDKLYGNCLVFNQNVLNRVSLISGSWFGLKLSFYVNHFQSLNVFNSLFRYGAHVRVGNGSYMSDDTFQEILLSPGFITSVSIERSFNLQLAKPYSVCDIDNDGGSSFDSPFYNLIHHSQYEYTQQMCFFICYQSELIKRCNCSDPWFISLYDQDVCETNNQTNCLVSI